MCLQSQSHLIHLGGVFSPVVEMLVLFRQLWLCDRRRGTCKGHHSLKMAVFEVLAILVTPALGSVPDSVAVTSPKKRHRLRGI